MHKSRKKAAMDARLLKPSISGERSEYEEAADRAVSRQLDLNAPLLSVRRNRTENGTASETHETQLASLHNAAVNRCSSNLGNVSRRPLIPFFTWELLPQAQESAAAAADATAQTQIEEESPGDEFAHPVPRVLAPPPRQHQIEAAGAADAKFGNQKNRGANWDFLEARSEVEIAQTEANSVAPSYRVSLIDGEEDPDDEECEEAPISYNAGDRDMILRRFLPAATAIAKEMVSSLQQQQQQQQPERDDRNLGICEIWKPLAIHPPQSPSPAKLEQDRDHRHQQEQKITRKKKKKMLGDLFSSSSKGAWNQQERKKFGELIRMQSQDEFGEELDEIGAGDSGAVGGIICGFFPVIRMLRSSNCSRQQEPSPAKSKARIWRKLEPQERRGDDDHHHQNRRSWEADRHNGDGSSTEWWSDEGDQDHEEFEDANDSWRQNCRYTPSRGGLKSPAMPQSKGFLGMPRDRIVGKTFIKRMYPVNLENVHAQTSGIDLKISRSSVMNLQQKQRIDDAADSDSSDSLRSIKLDKCSSVSRQSSSNGAGSMEKVFCLDTLNQVRESGHGFGAAIHHQDQDQALKHSRSSRQNNSNSNNGGSSDQFGDFVEESAQILYTPHRSRKLQLLKSLRPDEQDELRSLDELRICWHDHQNEEIHGAAAVGHPNLILPTPRGPSQSWLKKTLPSKPPLGKKKNQSTMFFT